jgi:dTDP-4-dehydrorhamnose 3,5-epimerase
VIFRETGLDGLVVIEIERFEDARGAFGTTFEAAEWKSRGLPVQVAQTSVSWNRVTGTLRGMHFQRPPHAQAKLVRCSRGAVFDVGVDIRPGSPTYGQWFGTELSADNGRMLQLDEGFAHGFLTLADESEVVYQISSPYVPDAEGGIRWNDPGPAIEWPSAPVVISDRDRDYPDYQWVA